MKGLVHVGAWDGSEYVAEAKHQPHDLLLIEPQTEAFEQLERNFARFERVRLVQTALGSKTGTVEMYVSHPSHSSSILAPKKHHQLYPDITFNGHKEMVQLTTLDSLLARRRLQGRYDHLVVDVQGYELEVLKGAKRTLRDIEHIKCEVNWDEVYEGCARHEEVDAYLAGCGFTRAGMAPHSRGMCGDAFYVK